MARCQGSGEGLGLKLFGAHGAEGGDGHLEHGLVGLAGGQALQRQVGQDKQADQGIGQMPGGKADVLESQAGGPPGSAAAAEA
jgi:hypothetical protein